MINAIQAMPQGGKLTVTAAEESTGEARVDVSDTGMGIEPQALEHVFEPFFTTKGARAPGWACRCVIPSSNVTAGASRCKAPRAGHDFQRVSADQPPRQRGAVVEIRVAVVDDEPIVSPGCARP